MQCMSERVEFQNVNNFHEVIQYVQCTCTLYMYMYAYFVKINPRFKSLSFDGCSHLCRRHLIKNLDVRVHVHILYKCRYFCTLGPGLSNIKSPYMYCMHTCSRSVYSVHTCTYAREYLKQSLTACAHTCM